MTMDPIQRFGVGVEPSEDGTDSSQPLWILSIGYNSALTTLGCTIH